MGASLGGQSHELLWSASADVERVASSLVANNGIEATLAWLNTEHLAAIARNDQIAAAGAVIVRNAVLRINPWPRAGTVH